jgi:HTH-type transcriptional regulator/antitoxin HigA
MTSSVERRRAFEPDYVVPPGETLAEMLEERGLTQTELAQRLGVSLKHVNQVLRGTAPISAELALGLESVLGAPADFWLKRESLYRGDVARQERRSEFSKAVEWASKFPLAELREHDLVPKDAQGPDLVEALLRFFGVASPAQLAEPEVAFRKSLKFESDASALRAWLRWGDILAGAIDCEPYDEAEFRLALEKIRGLTRLDPEEWDEPFRDLCARAGVAVVITPTFKKVRAHGATRWVSPKKAVVQLSLRYRWEDIFWFSFFHEAAHVLLHRKKQLFIEPKYASDRQLLDPELKKLEAEADRSAADTLIPRRLARGLSTISPGDHDAVVSYAEGLGVSPAIVVGRLQHETGRYNLGNQLRRQFEFRSDD